VIADPLVATAARSAERSAKADPSEDLSAVCAAVGATMVVRGTGGERVLDMREFHKGPYRTAVGPAEMLVEIRVPLREGSGSAYEKVDRRTGDWAVAAAGASGHARGRPASSTPGSRSSPPARTYHQIEAESALHGEAPSEELFARAGGARRPRAASR